MHIENRSFPANESRQDKTLLRRQKNSYALLFFFAALSILLLACLASLQIFQSESFTQQSQRQQTRKLYVPAKRGMICDRYGKPLNYTVPMYSLVIRPDLLRDPRDTKSITLEKISSAISELALYLGADYYRFMPDRAQLAAHLNKRTPMPIPLWQDLDAHTMARWNSRRLDFPGSELMLSWKRQYAYPGLASQLRGYTRLGEPETPDLKEYWNANFKEPVGKSGLEYLLNPELRGAGGSELLQTDVLSFRNNVLESKQAVNGNDILLTIDIELQSLAEEMYAEYDYKGAMLLLDAENGELLVLASCPGFDLNANKPESRQGAQFNRAVSGLYAPGSTIKPFMALYALEKGLLQSDEPYHCPGYLELRGGRSIACHRRQGHGDLALVEALAKSCNVFFCRLGQKMGPQGWDELAELFAFGRRLNTILYRQEAEGIAYSPHWLKAQKQSPRWTEADSAYAGIGQGKWLVTPLQMLLSYAMLLTGQQMQLKLLLDEPSQLLQSCNWQPEAQAQVIAGMQACVYAPEGTGRALQIPGHTMLGKTGTAEVGGARLPQAWCVAASPAEKPRFIGLALVENAGGGGRVAAPLLKKLMQAALQKY
ncbi:MAG: penicillin-binding transpeptidase domain-containing protein [Lentisphaeria bacterium]|jgi:penicillin-binding protein 2|nr:penicillin-binding transpeptidase domain-containing protein [Lentisphaeria bacterium]